MYENITHIKLVPFHRNLFLLETLRLPLFGRNEVECCSLRKKV